MLYERLPPVVPGTMCIRRELIVGLGGWMALLSSEDAGLFIATNVLAAGYFIPEIGLFVRNGRCEARRKTLM
ncbi:hypothetical protein [Micromonospora sp. WMMD710]|uniref:hypothetical protein n=1 Tax=Micromonospora sp. WMMD710 TaxID=3016085 RepID=UPI002415C3F5|nr:hypothetical protein [Micromonospora sp. WMMD710]MDG4761047.1 hypothetical protein [Micromonospora sp. WMMD710]